VSHQPPASSDDWIEIAKRELDNLSKAYRIRQTNDAKVDHAVRATEAALKALIWKYEGWAEWPSERGKKYKFLYGHKLDGMLDHTGLRSRLRTSAEHWASWQAIVNAVQKQPRYSPYLPSDAETNEVAKSARHPDVGIVPWLLQRYHEMI
jgi:hypothetical protein